MRFALPENEVRGQLNRQLASLFPISDKEAAAIDGAWSATFDRLEERFSRIKNKYYSRDGETLFEPLHGCQWTHFLYTLSNEIYHRGGMRSISDKIYSLNRALSSADLYYEVELPDFFTFDHPLGAVWAAQTTLTSLHSPRVAPWETTMAHTRGSGSEYSC